MIKTRGRARTRKREREKLSGLLLEKEFAEEREAGSSDLLCTEPHSGASQLLQPGLVWIKHQVIACWLVREGSWPLVSVTAGCVCS